MRRHPRPPMGIPGIRPPGMGPLRPPRGPPPPRMGPGPRGPRHGLGMPLPPRPPAVGPPPSTSVSSCTNSNDPASMDSRLFVGSLNTAVLTKESLEGIFSRYGVVTGISMHKGYAFVQFSHPDEARRAGASEDSKNYAGQAIDINIVSQPKNRNALKRSPSGRPVNEAPAAPKKPCTEAPTTNQSLQRTLVTLSGNTEAQQATKRVAATNAVKKAIATVTKKAVGRPAAEIAKVTAVSKPAVVKASSVLGTDTLMPNVVEVADNGPSEEQIEAPTMHTDDTGITVVQLPATSSPAGSTDESALQPLDDPLTAASLPVTVVPAPASSAGSEVLLEQSATSAASLRARRRPADIEAVTAETHDPELFNAYLQTQASLNKTREAYYCKKMAVLDLQEIKLKLEIQKLGGECDQ